MAAPDADLVAGLVFAIRSGDVAGVSRLVSEWPTLARGPLGGPFESRTALHVVCDWLGYFPNGPEIVRLLISAGADPNYRDPTPRSETPLHWASSSDDADVAGALGLLDRLEQLLPANPNQENISQGFGMPAPAGNGAPPNASWRLGPT